MRRSPTWMVTRRRLLLCMRALVPCVSSPALRPAVTYVTLAHPLVEQEEPLKMYVPLPVANGTASIGYEVHDDDEHKPTQNVANQLPAANGLAIVRLTIGAMFVWVFLRIWEKPLHPGWLRGPDQALHRGEPLAAAWKADGPGGKPRRDSGFPCRA